MAKKPSTKKKTSTKVDNAYVISQYYGFNAIDLPAVEQIDLDKAKSIRKTNPFVHEILPPVEEPLAILRTYKEEATREEAQPILLYCDGQAKGSHAKKRNKSGEKNVGLHIIGTPKNIAEAMLIKTSLCILQEEGYKDLSVEINNIGGKEAMGQFFKELNAYYRKHLSDMNSECRQLFKDGTHSLIACKEGIQEDILADAPSPLNYLSENSRDNFKEVIEYLESQKIPFKINKDVLGDPHYSSHTVFTILDKKSGKILATGSRYNQLARRMGGRKDIPSAGVSIKLKDPKQVPKSKLLKNAKFFFIQIGLDAKRKGLKVMEELRKQDIPIYQSLLNDKLSTQLLNAKKAKVPYILIMGQKEASDNTVVVRDTGTHKQSAIPIKDLIKHLKKLK